MAFYNPNAPIFTSLQELEDAISQIQEVGAVAPLDQTQDAIASWATSSTGPTTDHNLLVNTNVLVQSIPNSNSVLFSTANFPFGDISLYNGTIAIGPNSATTNIGGFTCVDNVCIGASAGGGFIGGEFGNIFIGNNACALSNSASTQTSIVMGLNACAEIPTVSQSISLGAGNAEFATSLTKSILIGHSAGVNLNDCDRNVVLGYESLFTLSTPTISGLSQSVLLGDSIGANFATGANKLICIGSACGANATTNHQCIYIDSPGVASENNVIRVGAPANYSKCFISGIRGVTTTNADAVAVLVDSAGQLGTVSSSRRFKTDIRNLQGSECIYNMRPVKFRYNGKNKDSIGLIAEEVEEVYPEMCIYNLDEESGKEEIWTVDYQRLPILLLAEIQKLNARIKDLEAKP